MKRLLAMGFAVAIALTSLGCAKSMTPEERFNAAMKPEAQPTTMECDSKAKMDIKVAGSSIGMEMDMSIRLNQSSPEKPEMQMNSNINLMGQTMKTESFYKDGYLYTSMMDQKVKMEMPIAEMMEQIKAQGMGGFTTEDLSSFEMKKVEKDFEFTYALKPESLNAYVEEAQQLLAGGLSEAGEISITSMSGTLLVDSDNKIKQQKILMVMTMDMMGQQAELTMDMAMDYKNVGGKVVIEYPTDLDSYQPAS